MIARQRYLGRADQVQVIVLQVVHLVGMLPEETGPTHDLGAHQHRRDHHGETVGRGLLRSELEQTELQQRAVAGEEVEARTGDLGAALHVDQAQRLTEGEVILRLEIERRQVTDRFESDEIVLAASRSTFLDDVGDRHVRQLERLLRGVLRGLEFLDLGREFLRTVEQRWPLLRGRLTHLLAQRLLLGAGVVARQHSGTTGGIRIEQRIDETWSSPRVRCERERCRDSRGGT